MFLLTIYQFDVDVDDVYFVDIQQVNYDIQFIIVEIVIELTKFIDLF